MRRNFCMKVISDQMMDNSGNAMMKMAIMFKNMKNEEVMGCLREVKYFLGQLLVIIETRITWNLQEVLKWSL